jgi:hypothetical protein
MAIGYLIRAELKKHIGGPPEDSRVCFVLPPPASPLHSSEVAEKAFGLMVEAIHSSSRHPVVEETNHQRIYVEDLRPFRNSLLLEKDGWKCFSVRN